MKIIKALLFICVVNAVYASQYSSEAELAVSRLNTVENLSAIIRKEYIRSVSKEEIWTGALRGMLTGLDKYSAYLTKEEVLLRSRARPDRGEGLGFSWEKQSKNSSVIVTQIIYRSPADKAGFLVGDAIVKINGEEITNHYKDSVGQLFIDAGRAVVISALHADGEVFERKMSRAVFSDKGVSEKEEITGQIAYIKINRFLPETSISFKKEVMSMQRAGQKALIIDLRGNGGGDLSAACEIADCFISANSTSPSIIIYEDYRDPTKSKPFLANSSNTFKSFPIAILTDKNTASSAEVLASSLRYHRKAVIIGETTMGKKTIQETFLLANKDQILLTTGRYRIPGFEYKGGLQPDILSKTEVLESQKYQKKNYYIRNKKVVPSELASAKDSSIELAKDVLGAALILGVKKY